MIKDETSDELGLSGHLVLHVHDLDHMEINLVSLEALDFLVILLLFTLLLSDGLNSINKNWAKLVGKVGMDLGAKGALCDLEK